MEAVIYGFIFGVISGCGIGGGSVLVPLLVLFMGVSQPVAQGVCLIAFLPSSIAALAIHINRESLHFAGDYICRSRLLCYAVYIHRHASAGIWGVSCYICHIPGGKRE